MNNVFTLKMFVDFDHPILRQNKNGSTTMTTTTTMRMRMRMIMAITISIIQAQAQVQDINPKWKYCFIKIPPPKKEMVK